MLKHMDLGEQSPVEVREAQSVNGPLAVLNEYYDVYVTQPEDAKWRLDNMHETYVQDMNSKYVYPNVFMSIDDTNKVSQYDTDRSTGFQIIFQLSRNILTSIRNP